MLVMNKVIPAAALCRSETQNVAIIRALLSPGCTKPNRPSKARCYIVGMDQIQPAHTDFSVFGIIQDDQNVNVNTLGRKKRSVFCGGF